MSKAITTTVETTITELVRIKNSYFGNPRYRVVTTDGTWNTAADHSFVYGLVGRESGTVVLTVGGRGTVVGIEFKA